MIVSAEATEASNGTMAVHTHQPFSHDAEDVSHECMHAQLPDGGFLTAVSGVNGTARSAARVATPRMKPQPEAARPVPTAPLTAVVHDAVRRWFQEAHKEAQRGDVVSHSLSVICICKGSLLTPMSVYPLVL